MGAWHGYVLVELRDNSGFDLRDDMRGPIRAALAVLNRAWNGKHPAALFQARASHDGRSAIYELTADLDSTGPDEALAAVASVLGMANPAVLRGAIRTTFFAPGGTWQQSRRAAITYITQHRAAWEAQDVQTADKEGAGDDAIA